MRAGAAATDENIIKCLEIGTPYAVTTRFLQLPTFIPANHSNIIIIPLAVFTNETILMKRRWYFQLIIVFVRQTRFSNIILVFYGSHDGSPLSASAADCWVLVSERRWMVQWCLVVVLLIVWCCTAAVAVRAKTTGTPGGGGYTYGAKVISSADKHHRRRREKRKHDGGCRTVIFGVRCKTLLFINTANDPATLRSSRRSVRAVLPVFDHRLC